jgi:hypothetical protein
MHILYNTIPINVPRECKSFFRAQRAFLKEDNKYAVLTKEIIDNVFVVLSK